MACLYGRSRCLDRVAMCDETIAEDLGIALMYLFQLMRSMHVDHVGRLARFCSRTERDGTCSSTELQGADPLLIHSIHDCAALTTCCLPAKSFSLSLPKLPTLLAAGACPATTRTPDKRALLEAD